MPALLDNSLAFCGSVSKVVLKAVEKTILWLEIHRTSKKRPLVENQELDFMKKVFPIGA